MSSSSGARGSEAASATRSTRRPALSWAASLPYVLELANLGVTAAVRADPALARGVNVWGGRIVHPAVAAALGEPAAPLDAVAR